jgi:Xaa-Pro dipeptidase
MNIAAVQEELKRLGVDGWLFFDHHRRDTLAYRLLELASNVTPTRRWYYFIPADGEARKLVHKIENQMLDSLPGEKYTYAKWQEQETKLRQLLGPAQLVAMQYSPKCAIPYVAFVDAGTVELVRALGLQVISSASLVQHFEAKLSNFQIDSHFRAGRLVDLIRRNAFAMIRERLRSEERITEYQVQQFIRESFDNADLITDHGPIVAVNAHASDPHYEPSAEGSSPILPGSLILVDMWAKLKEPESIYYDITWTAFSGDGIPEKIATVFEIVRNARQQACEFVARSIAAQHPIAGWQVDDVARRVIETAGFGQDFFHRTGHSIGTEVHGTGANMDNYESHDERPIISNTCFSIEPGIYLEDFGIRSEVNMVVTEGRAQVSGEQQNEMMRI